MSRLRSTPIASSDRSGLIRARANAFCLAFTTGMSPADILSEHFSASNPRITEHGSESAQVRLPYLGRTFHGRKAMTLKSTSEQMAAGFTCDDYFDLLGATLGFHSLDRALPRPESYIVDPGSEHIPGRLTAGDTRISGSGGSEALESGAVLVKAHAGVEALKSGVSWEEDFVFLMSGFDEEGRIGHLEIWSDNLSAWLAVGE